MSTDCLTSWVANLVNHLVLQIFTYTSFPWLTLSYRLEICKEELAKSYIQDRPEFDQKLKKISSASIIYKSIVSFPLFQVHNLQSALNELNNHLECIYILKGPKYMHMI